MPIHVLDENLVKRIAAGEVIERPVSVVKELLENSIDAKSTRIEIRIDEGGIANILVSDNGIGIAKDDISKLLHRHSTSKINSEDDLDSILTLGFRGEALYSIASVTHLRIKTRHRDETEGTELFSRDSKITIETVSAPIGTTIEATGLFHNTPARKKFLKSPSAEYQRIAEVVARYVLAYPEISFELSHNGRSTLKSLGGSPQDPLIALWGANVTAQMLPIDFRANDVRITGFVSNPSISRTTRKDISIFLNGRLVRDSGISFAIERAYQNVLPSGRFPIVIMKIAMPPQDVDVNVHPNKREVRLSDPKSMFSYVNASVDRALGMYRPLKMPDTSFEPPMYSEPKSGYRSDTIESIENIARELPADVFYPDQDYKKEPQPLFKGEIAPRSIQRGDVIEYLGTYLVFEDGADLVLVDFHNLHERILFEQMEDADRNNNKPVLSQKLMFPESFTLPPDLAVIAEDESEFLNRIGFEIEPFGSGAFILRSVPHFLKDSAVAQALIDILTEASSEKTSKTGNVDLHRNIKISAACKSAVKAGKRLKPEEMDYILNHAHDAKYMTCPHGRPTMIKLPREFFDGKFKRKSHEV